MSNVVLHPTTIAAINAEVASYEARELRLLAEIASLHRTIGAIRGCCELALLDCMLPNNCQAIRLRRAIELIDGTVGPESRAKTL